MSGSVTQKEPKTKSLPVRFTREERAELERRAGGESLGSFIRGQLFAGDRKAHRAARAPVKDQVSIAQLLGLLGKSDVGARLDYLVTAHECGTLVLDDETRDAIVTACAEVHAMRALLMKALGHRIEETGLSSSLSSTFNSEAGAAR